MTATHEPKPAVRSLRELPQAVAPERDLWPAIALQLPRPRRVWAVPASLAAGFVVVVLGVVIAIRAQHGADTSGTAVQPGALIRAALTADPAYQSRREDLLRALPAKLAALPPESQQRVRSSLLGIQTAMKNIEAELGRDSGDALLQELLISICQEEMRVLVAVSEADGPNQEI